MFDLHVHVDCPDVHTLGVVAHDTLKHGSARLTLARLVLENTVLRNHVDVQVLWKRLQALLQNNFRLRKLFRLRFEEELNIGCPNIKLSKVLLAKLLKNGFHMLHLIRAAIDLDQLQIDLDLVVALKCTLNNLLQSGLGTKLILKVHESYPQVKLVRLCSHAYHFNRTLSYFSSRSDIQLIQYESHILDPQVGLVLISDE